MQMITGIPMWTNLETYECVKQYFMTEKKIKYFGEEMLPKIS